MKLAEIIKVYSEKTIFGKKGRGYIAQFGEVIDSGKDKESALKNLVDKINKNYENRLTRKYWFANNGDVFCLYFADGWCYDIVHKADNSISTCMFSAEISQLKAIEKIENHLIQYNLGLIETFNIKV